jgi:Cytochrome c554 and c-prime
MLRASFAFLLCAAASGADHPCAGCHSQEAKSQPQTAMGIAIQMPGNQHVLKRPAKWTLDANGYHYSVEDGTYTVSNGAQSLSLPIRYAFGIGLSGQTWVFEYQGKFYESMVSYYTTLDGLAVTVGSERLKPHNLVEAMGRETSDDETLRCFGCHSSGAVRQGKLELATMKPGLDCEHCHAGSTAHMEAVKQGKQAAIPQHLADRSAEDTAESCGACHRTWAEVVRMRTWGELNVRFQPYRLANSKCYLGNDKRISCTACHNPHTNLVKDDASYDPACLACHAKAAPVHAAQQKPCPVSDHNCASCHMPKVELPGSHSVFTDHQIRIVRAGDRYPN